MAHMETRRTILKTVAAWTAGGFVLTKATLAGADTYPSRPITLIIPAGPGSSSDIVGRMVADGLGAQLGKAVVVENKPGAGAIGATKMVASAPPDGYTLILAGTGHALTESLYKKKPYDILKEFIPISKFAQTDIAMLAGKKSNYQNMQEFLRAAKENPGKLVVGIPLLGTGQHLTAEILKKSGKVDFLIVPYKTSGALHMALAQGEADLIVDQVPAVLGQIQAGEMRPLAIASSGRSPVLPDTPTLQELGLTKYEFASTGLIAAPAGTPAAIVAKINAGVKKTLEDPELQARFKRAGVVPVSSTPEESRAYFVNQLKSIGDTINLAKIPRQ